MVGQAVLLHRQGHDGIGGPPLSSLLRPAGVSAVPSMPSAGPRRVIRRRCCPIRAQRWHLDMVCDPGGEGMWRQTAFDDIGMTNAKDSDPSGFGRKNGSAHGHLRKDLAHHVHVASLGPLPKFTPWCRVGMSFC